MECNNKLSSPFNIYTTVVLPRPPTSGACLLALRNAQILQIKSFSVLGFDLFNDRRKIWSILKYTINNAPDNPWRPNRPLLVLCDIRQVEVDVKESTITDQHIAKNLGAIYTYLECTS